MKPITAERINLDPFRVTRLLSQPLLEPFRPEVSQSGRIGRSYEGRKLELQ